VTLSPPLHDFESWVVECNCSICARNGYLNVYVQNECIQFETIGLESELVEVCWKPSFLARHPFSDRLPVWVLLRCDDADDATQKYKFGKERVQHYFCSRCGSSLMAESIEPGFYEGVKALNVWSPYFVSFLFLLPNAPHVADLNYRFACSKMSMFGLFSAVKWMGRVFESTSAE
jgi:hypothetical protein